jgi:hypothetical protein
MRQVVRFSTYSHDIQHTAIHSHLTQPHHKLPARLILISPTNSTCLTRRRRIKECRAVPSSPLPLRPVSSRTRLVIPLPVRLISSRLPSSESRGETNMPIMPNAIHAGVHMRIPTLDGGAFFSDRRGKHNPLRTYRHHSTVGNR